MTLPAWDDDWDDSPTWPDPQPLRDVPTPDDFPVDVFPDWIAEQVELVSTDMQCPPDLPAQLAITALSICFAGHIDIAVGNTWIEPLNTYCVTGLKPGENKSPNVKLMLRPIVDLEIELQRRAAPTIADAETERKLTQKLYNKAIEKGERAEALHYGEELAALRVPVMPRLLADDSTPEKLADLLREHDGRLAIVSTEGGVFELMAGRYSDRPNFDVYLKAWSGDTIRVDRVSREASIIQRPLLTIGLTVQPDVIRDLAEIPQLRGRGLTARFMYAIPQSRVGTRRLDRLTEIDPMVIERYSDRMQGMAIPLHLTDHEPPTRLLALSPEALDMFLRYRQALEDQRGADGSLGHMVEWSIKLESTAVRLAGLLHLAWHGGAARADVPVSADTMARALRVADYWISHARVAHELWMPDRTSQIAASIIRWCVANGKTEITVRDAYSINRRDTPKADDVVAPLQLLVDKCYMRTKDGQPVELSQRGRPAQVLAVRDDLTAESVEVVLHARCALKAEKSITTTSESVLRPERVSSAHARMQHNSPTLSAVDNSLDEDDW